MKINIQESLKERDAVTGNRYNLYSNYCSHTYTVEQKKNIAEAIYKGATDRELLEMVDDAEVEYREVQEYARDNSNRRFRDEDGNIFSIWDLLNDFIDWELDDKVEEEPDKSVKELFIDYIRNSTDKNGTLEEIRENLEEASYGGAYDIDDDQYFTKEDLMEFAEEVMYVLHTNAKGPLATPDYTDLYVDGNQIFITVIDEDGNEFTDKISVDFRRVKRLSDLISKYTLPLAERIMAQADDFYRDINEGCGKKKKKLIKEDVDRDYDFYLNLIDIDVRDMLKEYHEAGNRTPSDILVEQGYTDTDSEIMYREVKDGDHTYRLVIDFEPVWEDNTIHYYVLKDGRIPSGYTYTKTAFDEEELEEDLDEVIPYYYKPDGTLVAGYNPKTGASVVPHDWCEDWDEWE